MKKFLRETCGDLPEAPKKKHQGQRILNAVERYDPETFELVGFFEKCNVNI